MDRGVRTFSTWEMTQALLSCFVMRLGSFREVEAALKIPDSTFGDALEIGTSVFSRTLRSYSPRDSRSNRKSKTQKSNS
ncbi:MAG: hypothetical protein IPJ84_12050 [Bdellovibrionales bacterium]|nr:hypothetical protein [Bdellovibrionales bacterium]